MDLTGVATRVATVDLSSNGTTVVTIDTITVRGVQVSQESSVGEVIVTDAEDENIFSICVPLSQFHAPELRTAFIMKGLKVVSPGVAGAQLHIYYSQGGA